jgi:hypothetical protein
MRLGHNYFDVLFVNNVPELHLVTALECSTLAKRIIIQKPQDLNFPLIRTIAAANGFQDFRDKTVIHDHYRNKGGVPALLNVLPDLHRDYGQFRRLLFFLTECRSVNDEVDRAPSLKCGMIQDLGVHMLTLFLECMALGTKWEDRRDSDNWHERTNAEVEVVACPKLHVLSSILGDAETFAAIDLRVKELIEFPAARPGPTKRERNLDALIVVGKGLAIEQGVNEDLKVVVAQFERGEGYEAVIDLATQEPSGIQQYLTQGGQEVNKLHGGLNRPLMLISPNPPVHALEGLGGAGYQQWQGLPFAESVATIVQAAKQLLPASYVGGYLAGRPLGDLLRELATGNHVRPIWGDLGPLTRYLIRMPRPQNYCP